jgi:3-deoxy-D-manno-octulosonic-acid transferase
MRFAALEDRGQLVAAHRQPGRPGSAAGAAEVVAAARACWSDDPDAHFLLLMWWLALPLVLGRLWWRGRKEPGYRQHLGERLGFYGRAEPDQLHTIMVHAVSVGETRAAEPLVDALLAAYPDCRILLTHMTPTGRATGKRAVRQTRRARGPVLSCPTTPASWSARFLRHFAPPHLHPDGDRGLAEPDRRLRAARRAGGAGERAPVRTLAAARPALRRPDEDAARASRWWPPRPRPTPCASVRWARRGSAVTGSIKFDVVPPEAALQTGAMLRERHRRTSGAAVRQHPRRRGGAHPRRLPRADGRPAGMLLLLVPRHPQRFDEVARMVRRTRPVAAGAQRRPAAVHGCDADVLLGDSMGEMFAYYAACDCAFIGGSLLPLGGQNLIEACALGKPVLVGEHTFNFLAATEEAVASRRRAARADAAALMREAARLLGDDAARAAMGATRWPSPTATAAPPAARWPCCRR